MMDAPCEPGVLDQWLPTNDMEQLVERHLISKEVTREDEDLLDTLRKELVGMVNWIKADGISRTEAFNEAFGNWCKFNSTSGDVGDCWFCKRI